MSEESELAQLRRKLQEAEQRAKEADERAGNERKERIEAEQRAEKERREREEAEQREHAARFINVKKQLLEPLPAYSDSTNDRKRSYTKAKRASYRPLRLNRWDEFDTEMAMFLSLVENKEVPREKDILNPQQVELNVELLTQYFVTGIFQHTEIVVRHALEEPDLVLKLGANQGGDQNGGFPDLVVSLNDVMIFIAELKRPSVHFTPDTHLADVDLQTSSINELETLIQTYSYLITKGYLVYGMFTNYNYWAFMKRIHDGDDQEEVVKVTRFFDRDDARLALATFMFTTTRVQADNPLTLPPGKGMVHLDSPPDQDAGDGGPGEESSATTTTATTTATTRRSTGATSSARRMAPEFFDVGTEVAGVVFTTTQQVLGVESLSVHAREDSKLISCSEKSCSFRYRGQGKDLVWRQLDVYGLPRNFKDYSLDVLQDMVTQEIRAYMHLRPVWGELVPQFVYFGNDFAMLWAFVTTYEGVSLRTIEKENRGLTQSVKSQARSALARLHSLGVIHGDAVPRNVLQRERDGNIIWVDFECSTLLSDTSEAEFARLAEQELRAFESELVTIPTLPEPIVIPVADAPATAPKRTKVFCCGANPCPGSSRN